MGLKSVSQRDRQRVRPIDRLSDEEATGCPALLLDCRAFSCPSGEVSKSGGLVELRATQVVAL